MTARTRNEPPNLPIVALGLYLLGAALPVGVLFARTAARDEPAGATERAPSARTAAEPRASGLPPFDAYARDEAPAFPDLDLERPAGGEPARLSSFFRGPAIVHLWSLACRTCADEWGAFAAFRAAAAAGADGTLPMISVVVVPEESAAGAAAKASFERVAREGWFGRSGEGVGADWAVPEGAVLSGGEVPTAERPMTGYPETFVLDADRRIRLRLVGPAPWEPKAWTHLLSMIPDLDGDAPSDGPTGAASGAPATR